jgi:thiamine pyrophosphokinase
MECEDGLVWPLSDIIANHSTATVTSALVSGLLGACIILNVPPIPPEILMNIFLRFRLRICADGGANILYESMPLLEGGLEGSIFLPDVLIGDFDSIRSDVRSAYASAGVKIIQILDQSNTDLDKALHYIESETTDDTNHFIVIAGSIGAYEGRIDQFFAVINSMYRYVGSKFKLISLGNESVMIVLSRGMHILNLPPAAFHQHCGLVPIFGQVQEIITTGLRWNLDSAMGESAFGGLVSTNNIVDNLTVTVCTSHPILFTFAYR